LAFGVLMTMLNWLPCFIGDKIETNSQKLIQKLYQSNWLAFDTKKRKDLILMQTILQVKPIKVKVAESAPVNFESLLKVMHFAFSVVIFCRSLKH
jgi:7tm Odorant receptor